MYVVGATYYGKGTRANYGHGYGHGHGYEDVVEECYLFNPVPMCF